MINELVGPAKKARAFVGIALVMIAFVLSGCGGTRVMTAQKSIVFEGAIYNVASVREVRPVEEIILPDGTVRNLAKIDDREVRDLFDAHGSLRVRFSVMLDDTELRYVYGQVDRERQLRQVQRRFEDAMEDIQRFLAHRKQTQLKLS